MRLYLMLVAALWLPASVSAEPVAALAQHGTTVAGSQTVSKSTADHSKFEALQGPFQTGPEVTKACLSCHTEAAKQLHQTKHWRWEALHPETGQTLGKRTMTNSFCGAIASNYPRCTSCHIGYGWKDATFDFSSEANVDCLVCHDTTQNYKKFPTGAGHPTYEPKEFPPNSGKIWQPADLANVAQQVGKTSRQTCGACHFYGGGGDAVKHGDLDSSMTNPDKSLDVHLGKDGLNFACSTCHMGNAHDVKGSRYAIVAKDTHGIDVPGRDDGSRATCESCHSAMPHQGGINNKLNDHTDKIACQTCHIPEFARGGKATKTWWDWSTAGQKTPDGKPIVKKDANGNVVYDTQKGDFEWAANVVPVYAWYAGETRFTQLDEKIDPSQVVALNTFSGSYDDPNARIWPFKVMRGKQPYDKGNSQLVVTHLFGKDDSAYWKSFDWGKSITAGMQEVGADYSGEYDFVETTMHWPLTHMIAPADQALDCESCHSRDGRMQNLSGFYMPGRGDFPLLDKLGWLLVLATLAGVLLHGIGRVVLGKNRS
ncbi:MAG: tetrathionate reductase family octaheme c-type cytochrome [Gammaproteobacteria bacterium]|nr:tetrathionate reductase family octaheme c-type cytochrome [Gammaproteobacteria bacterium]